MKKAVARYEQVAGAKVNYDKSKGLWLGAWRGGVPHLRPWSVVQTGPPTRAKLVGSAKIEVQVGTWL